LDYGPVGLPLGKARRNALGTCDAEAPVSFGIQVRPGVDDLASAAQVAEGAGFAYAAVRDRTAPLAPSGPGREPVSYDAVATLSYVAAATRRIRLLGLGDVLPCCDPGMIARQWSTLDALSGGRAVLGVGGADLDDRRFAAVRAEVARPHPDGHRLPIWIEGSSPAAMRRAAEVGDGWLSTGPPEGGMSAGIARLRELRERAGRADEPFTVGAVSGPLYVGEPRWDIGRAVHGSPEQIASFLRVLAGLGVDQIEVAFRSRDAHEQYEQIRLFGAEVAPRVGCAAVL
jgi:alkanesulfonate monooxygenase SsuD/methylene tetrahydromethanopterin reductase-like flavin-dependent oxidoreductase (luciferase family)